MGILGLTTYIAKNSEHYLEPFDLHDSYLVIDGNSLASQLYNQIANRNCAFGGDYDKYANHVRRFFENLIKCNVIPLVLIDGGYENKKIRTTHSRLNSKVRIASYISPSQPMIFFPLLMKEVFKDVMNEKEIRYAQCEFEADNDIAAVARALECPVLSYDSDFFIYNVLYIPFNTIESGITKNSASNGFVKKCKIYRVEKFLNSFGGMERSLLPLVATLLGNDYIKRNVFNQFFQNLKLSKLTKKHHNEQQRRIAALMKWLSPHNINTAIAAVLLRICKKDRRNILKQMEMIISGYTKSSPHMLAALGFSEQDIADLERRTTSDGFIFEGDLSNLELVESPKIDAELSEEEDLEEDDEDSDDENEHKNYARVPGDSDLSNDLNSSTEYCLSSIAPAWFVTEFSKGRFPSYFVDMLYHRLYFCPPQIDDYTYPAAHYSSLKIITVIFELLASENRKAKECLEYVVRGENNKVVHKRLEYGQELFGYKLPPLSTLNTLPVTVRSRILTDTLGIGAELKMGHILPKWRLYICTMMYWTQQTREPLVTNCHIWSLLCAMLFDIIDKKIGFYRTNHAFKNKYHLAVQSLIDARKNVDTQDQYLSQIDMMDAYDLVTKDDCLVAALFFIPYFMTDPKTIHNTKAFDVTTIHSYAQFQSCLRHCMHLNAVLGCPYPQPVVAEMYNGTLLYNLYHNFKKRSDIDAYLSLRLKDSPTVLRLLRILSSAVKDLLGTSLDNAVNSRRKRKNKNKSQKMVQDDSMSNEDDEERLEKSTRFSDPNNPFCILNSI